MTTEHQQKVIEARKLFLDEAANLKREINQRLSNNDSADRGSLLETFRRVFGNRKS